MVLREEVEQAEEQERKTRGLDGRPPPCRRLEDPLEARGRRREAHLGDAHGFGLVWGCGMDCRGGKAEKVRKRGREQGVGKSKE